jgi:hypothetical protein
MTEAEWINEWANMLTFLRDSGGASDRKLRLFACGCVRHVWHLISADYSEWRVAVEKAEEHADGLLSVEQMWEYAILSRLKAEMEFGKCSLFNAGAAARAASNWSDGEGRWSGLRERCVGFSAVLATTAAAHAADAAAYHASLPDWTGQHIGYYAERPSDPSWRAALVEEQTAQAHLLRDILHPRPAIDPVWLTWNYGIVKRLAEVAYQERELPSGHLDVARLAVLADALTDAGCTDTELLDHLRGPGVHVRGCSVLDLILGKS